MKESYTYPMGIMDSVTIEKGTYIRPIEACYVPKHVLEDKRWSDFDSKKHYFIYWQKGFAMVPKSYVADE